MFPNATFMKETLKIQDIPSNSCILIDDYILNRIDRLEMQKIIHYHLRHRNIAMILVIYTLHLSGIYRVRSLINDTRKNVYNSACMCVRIRFLVSADSPANRLSP